MNRFVHVMSLAKILRSKSITRVEGSQKMSRESDMLAVEEPLEIRIGGRSVAVVMRTPGHDRELAAGFLVTEGLVRRRDDLLDMVRCTGEQVPVGETAENVLEVMLAPAAVVDFSRLTRHVFTSSSCGICSKASIEAVKGQFPPLMSSLAPRRQVLVGLPQRLAVAQAGFAATGGLHA